MDAVVKTELARLIRFCKIDLPGMPGVLSHWDERKNILFVDEGEYERLPAVMQNYLTFTQHPLTRVTASGNSFERCYSS